MVALKAKIAALRAMVHAEQERATHLRTVIVRFANDVETSTQHMTGKGALRARLRVEDIARRMRAVAVNGKDAP